MRAIEIARRMAELGQIQEAQNAYRLAIYENDGQNPVEDMEAAIYLLQSGADYRLPYTCFLRLYNRGHFREDCLSIMTGAFYTPNVKKLRADYERNCKRLKKYPYLFRNHCDNQCLCRIFSPLSSSPFTFFLTTITAIRPSTRNRGVLAII